MPRKLHTWKLKEREIRLGERTLIVAILNVTPDSFSDGGHYDDPDRAFARAIELEEQGADIIDIGAESTRPGSARTSAAEEIRRLIPVLKRLKNQLRVPISVDTYKAEVAELAIEHGAEIINDPSGFTWDPLIAKAVVQSDAGLILNHMRGTPETWAKLGPMPDAIQSISKDLDASVSRARRAGVDRLKIVLDPGLGFGKRKEQNAEIIARLAHLAKLEYPILVGPSRKSFLAQATERDTVFATAAAVAASVLAGAHMVRVHDVAEMRAVLAVADEILRAEAAPDAEETAAPRRAPYVLGSGVKTGPAEPKERARLEPPRLIRKKLEGAVPPVEQVQSAPPVDVPAEAAVSEAPAMEAPREARPEREERPRREERQERSYPPRSGPRKFGPPRSDSQRSDSQRSDSQRSDSPRSGPPGSGPRKFGPPRSGPPGSGPRKFGPPRSGPPGSGPRKFGPPRSGPPDSGPRKFGPPRSGPPGSGPRKFGPPRSGPPGSGPSKFGPKRSGPPRPGGPKKFGPPRSGPPKFRPPNRDK